MYINVYYKKSSVVPILEWIEYLDEDRDRDRDRDISRQIFLIVKRNTEFCPDC